MIPINLQDSILLKEVSIDTWRAVLTAAGEQARLTGQAFTHDGLQASLSVQEPGHDLLDALEVIHDLGTESGRERIQQAADDQGFELDTAQADGPARELAAKIWIQSKTDSVARKVLVRAHIDLFQVQRDRSYREFVGKDSATTPSPDNETLRTAVSKWCADHHMSEVVDVFSYTANGEWYCQIIRGDPIKSVVEIRDQTPSRLDYRPAVSDILRYDPKTGRISIATRSSRLLQGYRSILGSLVADDDQFFAGENICSLRPLQDHGTKLFERSPIPGILRVNVVELFWRRGDRDQFWVGGRDCFGILRDLGARLIEGELIEAKLTIHFSGGGRPGRVTLKSPNRIDISAGKHESLVEQLLDAVGIRGAFDDHGVPQNFWSRYPWRMTEADWRRYVGAEEFDRMVKEQTLRSVALDRVAHPDHPAAAGALQVVDLAPGEIVGVSEDDAIPRRTLTLSDVQGYEIDAAKLARDAQSALQLEGGCNEIENGLWHLGRRTFAPTAMLVAFLALRQPSTAAALVIVNESKTANAVLIVPQCCHSVFPVPQVRCRIPQGPYNTLTGSVVQELQWQAVVPAPIWAPDDLIIDVNRGVCWYRSVEITGLHRDTHPFKFAVEVARVRGQLIAKQDLNALLSPSRNDQDAAKEAKRDLVKLIKAAFKAQGRSCPADVDTLFVSASGGYRLQGSARLIE